MQMQVKLNSCQGKPRYRQKEIQIQGINNKFVRGVNTEILI